MRLNDSDSGPAGNGRTDLAKLFIIYGLLAVALLAMNMPPYQNVDEVSHFLRADAVSRGGLIGIPVPQGGGGGIVDDGIGQSARLYEYLKFRPDQKVTRAVAEPAKLFRSGDAEVLNGFANTAIYPPVLYAPAAAGIWMGNLLGLPVVQTLVLARLSTGVIAVALAAAAIIIAGPSAPFLFAVLTLPMSLALMASVSQDALILPLSAIAAALFYRIGTGAVTGPRLFWLFCMALVPVAMARPPYAPLALLALLVPGRTRAMRLAGASLILGCTLVWVEVASNVTGIMLPSGVHPIEQAAGLLRDPLGIFSLFFSTLRVFGDILFRGFIGQIGWLDVQLPRFYNWLAVLQLTLVSVLVARAVRIAPILQITATLILLASAGAIFAIQYLSWTPVGALVIDGVQGRYFLPLALLSVPVLTSAGAAPAPLRSLQFLVAIFPVLSIAIVMRAIVTRYYLG